MNEIELLELIDSVPESVLLLDSAVRVKFANRLFYRAFGLTAEGSAGRLVYQLGSGPWNAPEFRTLVEEVLPAKGSFEGVEVAHGANGGRKFTRVSGRKLERAGQEPFIALAMRDATGERRALDELHAAEERWRTVADAAQDGIWTIDLAGNTIFANANMAAMLGTTVEAMVGKPSFPYVFEEDVQLATELFARKVAGDRDPFECRLRRSDGAWFWVNVTAAAFHNAQGEPVGLVGAFRDIRERKLAETTAARHAVQLARSNADLQHFAYVTSHDLREPLRTMRLYSQMLLRRYEGILDSDAQEFLGYIADSAERMNKLVEDLLSYSSVAERDGGISAPVNLNKSVEWARRNLTTRIEASQAEIEQGELPTVYADELQMVQMFQNLLSNAIKYRREEPPRVHITAELRGNEWVVAVQDNGIGIPANRREYVFGIFKRLHGPEIPGTGIGLAICRKTAQNHGGRIWVESEPGAGSTFFFTIPASEGKPNDGENASGRATAE